MARRRNFSPPRPLLAASMLALAGCSGFSGSPWSGAELVAGDERTVSHKVGGWTSADGAAREHCAAYGKTARQTGKQVLNSASQIQLVYYDCVAGGAPAGK